MTGDELAVAAERLIGCRFRLHGRDPATGLDCVGVLDAALRACGQRPVLPTGYALRTRQPDRLLPPPASCGLAPAAGPIASGDVLLVAAGPAQAHLVIAASGGRFVHAHAALRRVVAMPGPLSDPVLHHWRPAPAC
jgi:cell wall-associated NlpC family hydrolase